MRQTFQQWMVLLSALVLLLLPALLCHATPMYSDASSSSNAYPRNPSGTKDFEHYGSPEFRLERDRQPLIGDALDRQFGTHIHYKRVPVLSTEAVPETTVKDALKSYDKVWLVGPPSVGRPDHPRYIGLEHLADGSIRYIAPDEEEIHKHLRNAHSVGSEYGENAQHLMFGRPFAQRQGGLFSPYKMRTWKQVKNSNSMFDVREAELSDLRTHLNRENHLKAYDTVLTELLGFVLDQEGKVLLAELNYIRT
ncbi:uncharacterized protein UBRO_04380 [Ustilago bromivora]|uniref:Uncharacterized protein n=1 Tax=Ustilago bromivora TaxID=307758 RepID=A0A1K0GPZ8_9BASI|nr:uncharacterized protein UBRO_04380 [Ustilago bromivora]